MKLKNNGQPQRAINWYKLNNRSPRKASFSHPAPAVDNWGMLLFNPRLRRVAAATWSRFRRGVDTLQSSNTAGNGKSTSYGWLFMERSINYTTPPKAAEIVRIFGRLRLSAPSFAQGQELWSREISAVPLLTPTASYSYSLESYDDWNFVAAGWIMDDHGWSWDMVHEIFKWLHVAKRKVRGYTSPQDFLNDRYGTLRLRLLCAVCGVIPIISSWFCLLEYGFVWKCWENVMINHCRRQGSGCSCQIITLEGASMWPF